MEVRDLLLELFDRIEAHVRDAVSGLSEEELVTAPESGANTIAWLVWHLTRIQDYHLAEILDADQVWVTGSWAQRCRLRADPEDTGYGHSAREAAAVHPEGPEVLLGYYEAVAARTREFLEGVTADELDRVIDRAWDPPVTLGVRLVSVADDDIQHAGQAKYLRGLLTRRARA